VFVEEDFGRVAVTGDGGVFVKLPVVKDVFVIESTCISVTEDAVAVVSRVCKGKSGKEHVYGVLEVAVG